MTAVEPEARRVGLSRMNYRTHSHLRYLAAFSGMSQTALVSRLIDTSWADIERHQQEYGTSWQEAVSWYVAMLLKPVS